jgi:hypothetical protein
LISGKPIEKIMTSWLPILPYLVFWAVAMQALLIRAHVVPPVCARCGRALERRYSEQPLCTCSKSGTH